MDKLSTIFDDILETICNGKRDDELQEKIDAIETALKRLQDLEQMLYKMNVKHGYNEYLKISKALEIIKKRFTIQFIKSDLPNYYGIMQIGINPIYIKAKEEFNLLKEVLL